jgi:tape measure domain-containing protein
MALQIDIVTNTLRAQRDLNQISHSVDNLDKTTSRAARSFNRLAGALTAAFAGGIALRGLSQAADGITNLQNKIALYVESVDEAIAVEDELYRTSRRTLTGINSVSSAYQRLAGAFQPKGASQEQILTAVQAASDAFRISGATTADIDNGLRQLGQALSGPVVQAEEFNSIIDTAPRLVRALEEELGIPTGQMKLFVNEGKILSEDVFPAIIRSAEKLRGEAETLAPTIDQGWGQLRDGASRFFGSFIQGTGLAEDYSNILLGIADTFSTLAETAFVWGASLRDAVDSFFSILNRARILVQVLSGMAINSIFGTIFADMKSVALAGLDSVISIFEWFKEKIISIFYFIGDILVWNSIWPDTIDAIVEYASNLWERVKNFFIRLYNGIVDIFDNIRDFIVNIFDGIDFTGALRSVQDFFSPWLNIAKTALTTVFTYIKDFFINLYRRIAPFFAGLGQKIWGFLPESFQIAIEATFDRAEDVLDNINPFTGATGLLSPENDGNLFRRVQEIGSAIKDAFLNIDFTAIKDSLTDIFVPNFQKIAAAILFGILAVKSQLFRNKARFLALTGAVVAFFNTPLSTQLAGGLGGVLGGTASLLFRDSGEEGGRNYVTGFIEGVAEANKSFGEEFFKSLGFTEEFARNYGSLIGLALIAGFYAIGAVKGAVATLAASAKEAILQQETLSQIDGIIGNKQKRELLALSPTELRARRFGNLARGPGALLGGFAGTIAGAELAETLFPESEALQMFITIGSTIAGVAGGAIIADALTASLFRAKDKIFTKILSAFGTLILALLSGGALAQFIGKGLIIALRGGIVIFKGGIVGLAGAYAGALIGNLVDIFIKDTDSAILKLGKALLLVLAGGVAIFLTALAVGASIPLAIVAAIATMLVAVFTSEEARGAITEGFNTIVNWFVQKWQTLTEWVGGIKDAMVAGFKDIFDYVFDPDRMLSDIGDKFSQLGTKIATQLKEAFTSVFESEPLDPRVEELQRGLERVPASGLGMGIDPATIPELRANGGFISGPGGPRSDVIPALLSNGEFVINAASTQRFLPLLEAINSGKYGRFSGGGAAGQAFTTTTDKPDYYLLETAGTVAESYRSSLQTPGLSIGERTLDIGKTLFSSLLDSTSDVLDTVDGQTQGLLDAVGVGGGGETAATTGGIGGTGDTVRNTTRRLTEFEKAMEALQKRYDTGRITLDQYSRAVEDLERNQRMSEEGIRELAFNYSRQLTENMKQELATSLADLLSGRASIKEFFGTILDTFTNDIISTFSDSFTSSLFDKLGLDKIFNDLFENMFTSIQSAVFGSTGDFDFSSIFKNIGTWFGAILGGVGGAATGGLITGPGSGTSDSILAKLSDGEYVVNARSTKAFLPLLEEINGYANGGYVGKVTPSNSKEQMMGSRQEFNINITGDVTEQTRKEIVKLLPQISQGVNNYNRERIYGR